MSPRERNARHLHGDRFPVGAIFRLAAICDGRITESKREDKRNTCGAGDERKMENSVDYASGATDDNEIRVAIFVRRHPEHPRAFQRSDWLRARYFRKELIKKCRSKVKGDR